MLITLFLLVLIAWILSGRWQRRRMHQIAQEIRCDIPMMPLLGHAYMFLGNDNDRTKSLQKIGREAIKQGGTCSLWAGNKLYICIADPVTVEMVSKECLEKDEMFSKFARDVSGNGSIFAPVKIWRPRRKILTAMFSQKNLDRFVDIFDKQSAVMVEQLRPMVEADNFSVWKYIHTYTFDSVFETSLGIKMNSQKEKGHPLLHTIEKVSQEIQNRYLQPWLHSDLIYRLQPGYREYQKNLKYMNDFFDKIVKEKWETMSSVKKNDFDRRSDFDENQIKTFLEMIIESTCGVEESLVEFRDEIKVLLLAGTDTSAVGASFCLVLLSRYPHVQNAVYEELCNIFGSSDRPVVAEELPKLKYLEVVIKETLRLYPPSHTQFRDVTSNVKLPCGTTLVNGMGLCIHTWATHRNPLYWGADAEDFRPERFLEGPLKHPTQFIPFGYGMRNCIGYKYGMMSMKTVLASVLRVYRVLPPVGLQPECLQDPLPVKFDVMTRHLDDFTLRLEKRPTAASRHSIP